MELLVIELFFVAEVGQPPPAPDRIADDGQHTCRSGLRARCPTPIQAAAIRSLAKPRLLLGNHTDRSWVICVPCDPAPPYGQRAAVSVAASGTAAGAVPAAPTAATFAVSASFTATATITAAYVATAIFAIAQHTATFATSLTAS